MDAPRRTTGWWTARRLESLGWIAVAAMWIIQSYAGVFRRDNDFLWHVERGQQFLTGRPSDNQSQWYPLARYAWDAGLTLVPYRVARGISLLVGTAAFVATIVLWRRMLAARWPISPTASRRAMLIAVLLGSPYVRRDLDDCGIHLLLLFFCTSVVYGCHARRGVTAGVFGALAASYKPTAVFLWPFLIWKRQWKAAVAMPIAVIGLNLLPAFFLGWDETIRYHRATADVYRRAAANRDCLANALEAPRHENQSLPFAVARFLQSVPADHELHLEHPLFLQFGRLAPEQGNLVVKGTLLLIAAWFAWRTRTVFVRRSPTPTFAAEAAAAFVLVALVSPLCWKQHLVLLLPAIFVRAWVAFHRGSTRADRIVAWMLAGSAILFAKDVVGRELATVAASYKFDTLFALGLFLLSVSAASLAPTLRGTLAARRLTDRAAAGISLPHPSLWSRRALRRRAAFRDDARFGDRAPFGVGRLRARPHRRTRPAALAGRQSDDEPGSVAADA
jgi:hypothetical protein